MVKGIFWINTFYLGNYLGTSSYFTNNMAEYASVLEMVLLLFHIYYGKVGQSGWFCYFFHISYGKVWQRSCWCSCRSDRISFLYIFSNFVSLYFFLLWRRGWCICRSGRISTGRMHNSIQLLPAFRLFYFWNVSFSFFKFFSRLGAVFQKSTFFLFFFWIVFGRMQSANLPLCSNCYTPASIHQPMRMKKHKKTFVGNSPFF